MTNNFYKVALYLQDRGFVKQAQRVFDLLEEKKKREQRQQHNKKILDNLKREDRFKSILEQHQNDLSKLKSSQPTEMVELDSPLERDYRWLLDSSTEESQPQLKSNQRYEVRVRYPSFNQEGKPYFDEDCLEETLIIPENNIEKLRQQAQQGYLQILSTRELVQKTRRS